MLKRSTVPEISPALPFSTSGSVPNSGSGGGGSGNPKLSWSPSAPTKHDSIKITVTGAIQNGKLHWGVNNSGSTWQQPSPVYFPPNSVLFNGSGPAVQSPFMFKNADSTLSLTIGPFNRPEQSVHRIAFVINYANNTWDNNGGQDYHIDFGTTDTTSQQAFVMDGVLDAAATKVASINSIDLYVGMIGSNLYLATQSASSQNGDMFIFITDSLRSPAAAPWAKSGTVNQWSYVLANESSNNWSGWFDKNGAGISMQNKSGGVLEGYFSPQSLFGTAALKLYIAVAKYATADGGALLSHLPANNGDGNISADEWHLVDYGVTSVGQITIVPKDFSLEQNFPNPFNPSTTITFSIADVGTDASSSVKRQNANTTITLYDLLGREVTTLVNQQFSPGTYSVTWNAKDQPSGMYFYRLHSGDFSAVKRMILLK
jgi:hypothetical protein